MIQAVVFDLGEVLASPPSLFPVLAQRLQVDPAEVAALYWRGREGYDSGSDDAAYWAPFLEALDRPADDDLMDDLALLDAGLWSQLRPSAHQLLRSCRAAGVTVAVLSNSPHAMQVMAERSGWRRDIDHLFISATLEVMKPDPRMFALVTQALAAPAESIAFIDDKQGNVEAALAAGWHAHQWVDDATSRDWLTGLGVLPGA